MNNQPTDINGKNPQNGVVSTNTVLLVNAGGDVALDVNNNQTHQLPPHSPFAQVSRNFNESSAQMLGDIGSLLARLQDRNS